MIDNTELNKRKKYILSIRKNPTKEDIKSIYGESYLYEMLNNVNIDYYSILLNPEQLKKLIIYIGNIFHPNLNDKLLLTFIKMHPKLKKCGFVDILKDIDEKKMDKVKINKLISLIPKLLEIENLSMYFFYSDFIKLTKEKNIKLFI